MIDPRMVAIIIGGAGPQARADAIETARAIAPFFEQVLLFGDGGAGARPRGERPNIESVPGWQIEGLALTVEGRVYGVKARRLSDGRCEEFLASLVVDASGADSCLPEWLVEAGRAAPFETASSIAGYAGRQRHYDKVAMPVGLAVVGQAVRSFGDPERDHAFALAGARLLAQCIAGGTLHAFPRKLAKLLKQEESIARPGWSVRVRLALGGGAGGGGAAAAMLREGRS